MAKISSDTETGHSSMANALRLAEARALACFLPGDQGYNRLRAAGLLTQDDRFSERKKPGQKKARKKPIWYVGGLFHHCLFITLSCLTDHCPSPL